jgi:hypothetical protein
METPRQQKRNYKKEMNTQRHKFGAEGNKKGGGEASLASV